MKRISIIFILTALLLTVSGCSDKDKPDEQIELEPTDEVTIINVLPEKQQKKLIQTLESSKLSNVDEFFKWVDEYNDTIGSDSGLITSWQREDTVSYDFQKLNDLWYKSDYAKVDVTSRMAAFLLTEATFTSKDLQDYGMYISDEVNKLTNEEKYKMLKENKSRFIAMYDELDASSMIAEEDLLGGYSSAYEEREIDYKQEKIELINVVMHDDDNNVLYIAHSAVLVKLDNGYLLIEKLGPGLPYQFSLCTIKDKLFEMLLDREEFEVDDAKIDAFILENNQPRKID